jgi:hypothetical protein
MEPSSKPKGTISRYEKLLAGLAADGVDFAVVGGLAVILNGYSRLPLEAGIIVSNTPENIRHLLDSLKNWGEGWSRELKPEDFISEPGAIRLIEDFPLDMFVTVREKTIEDFRPRLRYLEAEGVRIPYLAPEDLIFLKDGSWREKDQLDVAAMREIILRESK